MDTIEIKGMPSEANDYEFVVVVNREDGLHYMGAFANGHEAEQLALCFTNGMIIHNVRIQGKRKPEPPKERYYTFSGMWSWGCWATSREEAKYKFADACIDDFDLDLDHYEVEIDD